MKKLMYLFVAGTMFAFTACVGGETATEETATEAAVCANTGEPCLDDHSCCVVKEEADTATEAHADHDHAGDDHADHDHAGDDHGDHDHAGDNQE